MDNETGTTGSKSKSDFLKSLLTERNRGILLDIVIFLLNLLLMRYLTRGFVEIIQWANVGDFLAQFAIFLIFVAVFVLPPAGSILKRWRFHERFRSAGAESPDYEDVMGGCLFSPIIFFCLNVIIFSAINAFIFQFLIGDSIEKHGGLFVGSLLLGIILIILQTWIVYRYFSPPKEASGEFLRSRAAENLGDVCFYLNMILFQLFWNFITMVPFNRVSGVGDFLARLFFLGFYRAVDLLSAAHFLSGGRFEKTSCVADDAARKCARYVSYLNRHEFGCKLMKIKKENRFRFSFFCKKFNPDYGFFGVAAGADSSVTSSSKMITSDLPCL